MHFFKSALSALLFITLSTSSPVSNADWDGVDDLAKRDGCLTDASAKMLATVWENFFVNFNVANADKYLAPNFEAFSDSETFLAGLQKTGVPAVGSRAAFIKTYSTFKDMPTFTTLNVWHTCDAVILRWRWNLKPFAMEGIDILELMPNSHVIQTDYNAINGLAYIYDNNANVTCVAGKCELTYPTA